MACSAALTGRTCHAQPPCCHVVGGYLRGVVRGAPGQHALGTMALGLGVWDKGAIDMPWEGYLRGVMRGAPGQHALRRRAGLKTQAPQLVPVAAVQPKQLACATRRCW